MQPQKSLYGIERLEIEDLVDTDINHLIELTYYKIKETSQYAIEVVKTEHLDNKLNKESERINLFTNNEAKTNNILEILKRNKVTPIGLRDSVTEIVKGDVSRWGHILTVDF